MNSAWRCGVPCTGNQLQDYSIGWSQITVMTMLCLGNRQHLQVKDTGNQFVDIALRRMILLIDLEIYSQLISLRPHQENSWNPNFNCKPNNDEYSSFCTFLEWGYRVWLKLHTKQNRESFL